MSVDFTERLSRDLAAVDGGPLPEDAPARAIGIARERRRRRRALTLAGTGCVAVLAATAALPRTAPLVVSSTTTTGGSAAAGSTADGAQPGAVAPAPAATAASQAGTPTEHGGGGSVSAGSAAADAAEVLSPAGVGELRLGRTRVDALGAGLITPRASSCGTATLTPAAGARHPGVTTFWTDRLASLAATDPGHATPGGLRVGDTMTEALRREPGARAVPFQVGEWRSVSATGWPDPTLAGERLVVARGAGTALVFVPDMAHPDRVGAIVATTVVDGRFTAVPRC